MPTAVSSQMSNLITTHSLWNPVLTFARVKTSRWPVWNLVFNAVSFPSGDRFFSLPTLSSFFDFFIISSCVPSKFSGRFADADT